jgi:hypothetical protein
MVGKVVIDRFKFSKELGDQSTLNAITVGKVVIDREIFKGFWRSITKYNLQN